MAAAALPAIMRIFESGAAWDIAILGYGADTGVKSFAFVLLNDLSGQTHYFTDNGWLAAGGFLR